MDQVEAKLSHHSLSRVPNPTPHVGIECNGCMMQPLTGPRYKPKISKRRTNWVVSATQTIVTEVSAISNQQVKWMSNDKGRL